MKKIIIVAAALCAAVVTQAATIDWTLTVGWMAADGDSDYIDATAYAFAGDSSAASAMLQAVADNGLSALGDNIGYAQNTEEGFVIAGSGLETTPKTGAQVYDTASVYTILVDSTGTKAMIGTVQTIDVTEPVVAEGGQFFTEEFYTGDTSTWTSVAPEPTSGLLLLIGVAGLALRRRRA